MDTSERVLYPNEVESFLENLQIFDIRHIGSHQWFEQFDRIYKLSLQASLEVKSGADEMVKEEIVLHQKVPTLVHELITVELWRLKILPRLMKMEWVAKSFIPLYTVLYHEITLLSFLEILLFHEDVMESAGDTLVDLVDYCYRRIVIFKGLNPKEVVDDSCAGLEEVQRLQNMQKKISFESGIKSVSILSSIAQHKKTVPLSVLHRILIVHDIPLLFTELICDPPWVREQDGETEKFLDGRWKKVSYGELMKLSKVEGQLWISLLLLLLDPECQRKYDMSGFRKEQIIKLRPKINEFVTNQIPQLNEMARWLELLNLHDAPKPKSDLIMEQVPEIWENLKQSVRGKCDEIAHYQSEQHFKMSESELQEFCKKMGESFDVKNIEAMLSEKPLCAYCHAQEGKKRCSRCMNEWYCGRMGESFDVKNIEAMLSEKPLCAYCHAQEGKKRCSRCMNEWYCGRSCQVSHWTKHKPVCDLMANKKEDSVK